MSIALAGFIAGIWAKPMLPCCRTEVHRRQPLGWTLDSRHLDQPAPQMQRLQKAPPSTLKPLSCCPCQKDSTKFCRCASQARITQKYLEPRLLIVTDCLWVGVGGLVGNYSYWPFSLSSYNKRLSARTRARTTRRSRRRHMPAFRCLGECLLVSGRSLAHKIKGSRSFRGWRL